MKLQFSTRNDIRRKSETHCHPRILYNAKRDLFHIALCL